MRNACRVVHSVILEHKVRSPDTSVNMTVPVDLVISTILSLLQVVVGSLSLLQAYYMHRHFRLAFSQIPIKDPEIAASSIALPPAISRPRLVRNVSSRLSICGPALVRATLPPPSPPIPPTRVIMLRQHTSPLMLKG